jgi:hypothetical protein
MTDGGSGEGIFPVVVINVNGFTCRALSLSFGRVSCVVGKKSCVVCKKSWVVRKSRGSKNALNFHFFRFC